MYRGWTVLIFCLGVCMGIMQSVLVLVGEVDTGELRGCQKREGDGANAEKWLWNLMKGLVEFFALFF